ncbi:lysine exporter protein LysE/YggA [Psychromonas sp. CNPT3]|uniref:LysE family translocator n=1 Tax=Psychromonas sp. CNPT3 TaxID=314282 RepID=UPI00006E566F|nr:LysE family translocator [Psychromonas sp. CNPT3]AGH80862.1 lysine exporter protein LysE/YggA [Psychromonas sp. CNPT3]
MENYILFIAIASATILSPGPGVVFTITNSIKDGFLGAISGVLGVAIGMLCIAAISATSLATILSTSAFAFTILKYIGSAYLIYLGIKMWRSSSNFSISNNNHAKSNKKKFTEGFFITLLNPKAIFFFMALFPHFINPNEAYIFQFLLLAITFSVLVVIIHFSYSFFAKSARSKLSTPKGSRVLSKTSGTFYMLFGAGLAIANK